MTETVEISSESIKSLADLINQLGLKDWLSLVALFFSAIVAVLIGQFLQDRKEKRNREYQNKFSIFSTILGLRHSRAGNENFVIAINQIPIVFHKNEKVLKKLDRFIKTHVDPISPTEKVIENLNSDLNDLVLEVAKDLGYSNIDNNVMKSFYYPAWSFYRHQSDLIYNELYSLEKFHDLEAARQKNKKSNDPKD
jgi:hypothetical protein